MKNEEHSRFLLAQHSAGQDLKTLSKSPLSFDDIQLKIDSALVEASAPDSSPVDANEVEAISDESDEEKQELLLATRAARLNAPDAAKGDTKKKRSRKTGSASLGTFLPDARVALGLSEPEAAAPGNSGPQIGGIAAIRPISILCGSLKQGVQERFVRR